MIKFKKHFQNCNIFLNKTRFWIPKYISISDLDTQNLKFENLKKNMLILLPCDIHLNVRKFNWIAKICIKNDKYALQISRNVLNKNMQLRAKYANICIKKSMPEFLTLSKTYKYISRINKTFPKNMHFPSNYFIHKSIKQLLTLYLIFWKLFSNL